VLFGYRRFLLSAAGKYALEHVSVCPVIQLMCVERASDGQYSCSEDHRIAASINLLLLGVRENMCFVEEPLKQHKE
jgi:hypothetical protein